MYTLLGAATYSSAPKKGKMYQQCLHSPSLHKTTEQTLDIKTAAWECPGGF